VRDAAAAFALVGGGASPDDRCLRGAVRGGYTRPSAAVMRMVVVVV
jgi:hypothetical protein